MSRTRNFEGIIPLVVKSRPKRFGGNVRRPGNVGLADDQFRAAFLAGLGAQSDLGYDRKIEVALDGLAHHPETHLDIAAILEIANLRVP